MDKFSQPRAQLGGGLSKLPTELRVMIYRELFSSKTVAVYAIKGGFFTKKPFPSFRPRPVNHAAALLATCQAMYDEAGSVLYKDTEFHVSVRDLEYSRTVLRKFENKVHDFSSGSHRTFTAFRHSSI